MVEKWKYVLFELEKNKNDPEILVYQIKQKPKPLHKFWDWVKIKWTITKGIIKLYKYLFKDYLKIFQVKKNF